MSTSGSLGLTGSATTSSSLQNVNRSTTQATLTGSEILSADSVASTCTASTASTSGSTTITGGLLRTESGWNDGDAVYPEPAATAGGTDEHDAMSTPFPVNPTPGTFLDGHLHLSGTSRDDFRVVFNEQVVGTNSITVNAVHEYFGTTQASTLKGDLTLGRSVCGVTLGAGPNAAPVAGDDAYGTGYNTPLTVTAPGVLANDTDADGGSLTAGSASTPATGSVTLNADGSFTYTPNAGFSGTGTFTYTVTDNHGATDTGLVTITVAAPPPADLAVSDITDSADPVAPAGTVTYNITVTNNGPAAAAAVTLTSGVEGGRLGTATTTGGTCTVSKGKTRIANCDLGAFAVGASKIVTITATAPRKIIPMSLTATVSSAGDPNPGNNTQTEDTLVQR